MLSLQLLLVVFDLAYDLFSENSQLSRNGPLHYNKLYGITDHLVRKALVGIFFTSPCSQAVRRRGSRSVARRGPHGFLSG